MATNFTLKREKAVHTTPAVYEMEREHKAEHEVRAQLADDLFRLGCSGKCRRQTQQRTQPQPK